MREPILGVKSDMDRIGELQKEIGYQSPIQILYDGIDSMQEQQENEVIKYVRKYGIYVDKEELQKALNYERHQYARGFQDGRRSVKIDTIKEIDRLIERLEELKNEL